MTGLTSELGCLQLFKNNRDAQMYAMFTASLFPTALTYTMGAMSNTKRWSNGFKHLDVSRLKKWMGYVGSKSYLRSCWQDKCIQLSCDKDPKWVWWKCESLCVLSSPAPNQLYKMPLTDNQQYGWMLAKSPESWTQVKRFPRKDSEMTK